MADAIQEPEGGIDNTLAAAVAQVREQVAASEAEAEADGPAAAADVETAEAIADVVETVAADEAAEEAAAAEAIEEVVEAVAADEAEIETAAAADRGDSLGAATQALRAPEVRPAMKARIVSRKRIRSGREART